MSFDLVTVLTCPQHGCYSITFTALGATGMSMIHRSQAYPLPIESCKSPLPSQHCRFDLSTPAMAEINCTRVSTSEACKPYKPK